MRIRIFILVFFLSICQFSVSYADRDAGLTPADGFFLPEGNAKAGQSAFARLKCSACHWVQNETELEVPVAEKAGPILGAKQANYAPGWIANSIVSPSHTIAIDSRGESDGSELSRMGDFRDTMTVRELIDLVSYIRSLSQQETGTAETDGE